MQHDGESPGPSQTPSECSFAGQSEAAVAADAGDDDNSPLVNRVAKRCRTEREH